MGLRASTVAMAWSAKMNKLVLAVWTQCDHSMSGNNYNEEKKEITLSAEIQEVGRASGRVR